MARILVLGRNGLLARALARTPAPGAELVFAGRAELDLLRTDAIADGIAALKPEAVINAAALAAVDDAEADPAHAFALNRDAPEAIAHACLLLDVPFVHVSTDYVFGGDKRAPYEENDARIPVNVYGRSKAAGENRALAVSERIAIVRTSSVFDGFGARTFIATMLRLARTQDEVRVVADVTARPTYAASLAAACVALAQADARGVFHFAGAEDVVWADYAEAIFAASAAQGGPSARVVRVSRDAFTHPAPRPRDTRLDSSKIAAAYGLRATSWREAMSGCVAELLPG